MNNLDFIIFSEEEVIEKYFLIGVLLFLIIVSTGTAYADHTFTEVMIASSTSKNPWEKAMADLNGDGKLDMIVGSPTGPLAWYAYQTWAKTDICGVGSYDSACGIATADMDSDDDIDVIMGGIFWYENPLPSGNPSSSNWIRHTLAKHRSHDLIVADLNEDRRLDIVSRNQNKAGEVVKVYERKGMDSWVVKNLSAEFGEGLAIADFDDDGDFDIAIPSQWYENPGDMIERTWEEHSINPSFNPVSVVRTGDINGDGRPDIVLSASEHTDAIIWMECPIDGTGSWIKHVVFAGMNSTHGLWIGDFDGDERIDIAASEFRGDGRLMVYYNIDGSGSSWTSKVLGTRSLHNIVVGDCDADGDPDIFGVACWGNPPAYLYKNERGEPANSKTQHR